MARIAAASAEALSWVVAFDERGLWRADGATSMSAWLCARYGLAFGTAREWVRVAHRLRELPRIAAAYRAGRISFDQLRPLSRFATAESDGFWARRAPELRPSSLWREARRHERVSAREAQDAHRLRSLSLWRDPRAPLLLYLEGILPGEQGAAFEAALSRAAEQVPADPDAEDRGGARLADALVALATASREAEPAPPTLVVHADAAVLAGSEPESGPVLAESEDGGRLAAETVRRLACDARIEWVLHAQGGPVGIGRRGRQVRGTVARLLRHRDLTCRFPGLRPPPLPARPSPGALGPRGPTDLDNLILLCGHHHRLLHEGGWSISGHPGRHLRFHDPTGRVVPSRAPVRDMVVQC